MKLLYGVNFLNIKTIQKPESPFEVINNFINTPQNWLVTSHDNAVTRACYRQHPEYHLSSHVYDEPRKESLEPWNNNTKTGSHELGLNRIDIEYFSTILGHIDLINIEYKILMPIPKKSVDSTTTDSDNISYCIYSTSLEFKIAAILYGRKQTFTESIMPDNYLIKRYYERLKDMLNNSQFSIEIKQ
jgi:hypothetical protein